MRLIIIGASGHGRVVADIAKKCGYENIVFLDHDPAVRFCGEFAVIGTDDMASQIEGDLFIAIGNGQVRKKLMELHKERHFPVLIHPSASVADDVEIGCGSVVMAGAVINSEAKLGKGVIVNTCASVDHDCQITDFVHIAVGAHLCGTVSVGEQTWIGAGAVVRNQIQICENCMIGVGAAVIKDIHTSGTYVGVPARKIK